MTDTSYLDKSAWPECIPWMEPTREYAPAAWGEPTHDHAGVDDYPHMHPAAASLGDAYLGDVCPYCGVPVAFTDRVVLATGGRGVLGELVAVDEVVPAYHPDCWRERQAEIHGHENARLDAFAGGGSA